MLIYVYVRGWHSKLLFGSFWPICASIFKRTRLNGLGFQLHGDCRRSPGFLILIRVRIHRPQRSRPCGVDIGSGHCGSAPWSSTRGDAYGRPRDAVQCSNAKSLIDKRNKRTIIQSPGHPTPEWLALHECQSH